MNEATFNQHIATLVPSYKPSLATHERLAQVTLVAVVGPSGVGKTTVMELSGLPMVVSDVTRKARPGEVNGVDNVFRSDYQAILQEVQAGEFVQIARGSQGDFKGTKASRYPETGFATMAITTAALPVFYRLGFKAVRPVFIVPPSYDAWAKRLKGRRNQVSNALFETRMQEAKSSFAQALSNLEFVFILNDDARTAAAELTTIADGRIDRNKSGRARQIAEDIFTKLTTNSQL